MPKQKFEVIINERRCFGWFVGIIKYADASYKVSILSNYDIIISFFRRFFEAAKQRHL